MKHDKKHIIKKQVFDLRIRSSQEFGSLQMKVQNIWQQELSQAVDRLLDRIIDAEQWVRIEKLELELGHMTPEEFDKEFPKRLLRELEKAIGQQLNGPKKRGTYVESTTTKHMPVEALRHFLEKAYLPWWYSGDLQDIESSLLESLTTDGSPAIREMILADGLSNNELKRLCFQFSKQLLAGLAGKEELPGWISPFPRLSPLLNISSDKIKRTAWLVALRRCKELPATPQAFYRFLLPDLFMELGRSGALSVGAISSRLIRADLEEITAAVGAAVPPAFLKELNYWIRQFSIDSMLEPGEGEPGEQQPAKPPEDIKASPPENGPEGSRKEEPSDSAGRRPSHRKRKPKSGDKTERGYNGSIIEGTSGDDPYGEVELLSKIEIPEEGIYLENAGLVLLHPFLTELFNTLEWVEGKDFVKEECREAAVHLLGWIATGEEEIPEPQLVLPKVLCHMPVEQPLEKHYPLSKKAKANAEEMLKAVIGHWKALKNTGAEAFRHTFLQREGKLSWTDNGPTLQVEWKTQDILLDRLPWGIGIIKLPWMREILHVKWDR